MKIAKNILGSILVASLVVACGDDSDVASNDSTDVASNDGTDEEDTGYSGLSLSDYEDYCQLTLNEDYSIFNKFDDLVYEGKSGDKFLISDIEFR